MNKSILMIVTSHAELGKTGKPTGIWAEELTTPFYMLQDAGYNIVIASPQGGKPPFAQGSFKTTVAENEGSVLRFLSDAMTLTAFEHSVTTASVIAANFAGMFLPGGHGTMWDTAIDPHTARLVSDCFNAGKPVAAVCHGPAGLIKATRPDGKSILEGKRVSAFTNAEETAAGLMDVVPFHLETEFKRLGGHYQSAPNWQAFAVRDGHLITGQNPASSALVAQHMLEALNT